MTDKKVYKYIIREVKEKSTTKKMYVFVYIGDSILNVQHFRVFFHSELVTKTVSFSQEGFSTVMCNCLKLIKVCYVEILFCLPTGTRKMSFLVFHCKYAIKFEHKNDKFTLESPICSS